VNELKFLGLKVTSAGKFLPWRDDFTKQLYGVKGRLAASGLGHLPIALIKGLSIKVIPAILYGCEVWAMHWLDDVIYGKQSPFLNSRLNIVLNFIKKYLGLPTKSFGAAVFKMCNMPSMLALVLPRIIKYMKSLTLA
jgi:hypothetical protein